MQAWLRLIGWLACAVYSTIPAFWLMIHPFAARWRTLRRSPYLVLVPVWMMLWMATALITRPWHSIVIYQTLWPWGAAILLFAIGIFLYIKSTENFTAEQLGGLPELQGAHRHQQLVTNGIRSRVRHPVYLAHLCEMLAWSLGTGLVVCWSLTVFAFVTGMLMIRMEDTELEERFGDAYRSYRQSVPALLPRIRAARQL